MDQQTGRNLAKPSTASPTISARAASNSELTIAIHSPHDPGETLKRVNAVLACFFVPSEDDGTKAGVREEFVRALSVYPNWAVQRGFDRWMSTMQRRPSPGEIVILVGREISPITDEIARRKRATAEQENAAAITAESRVSAETAARILDDLGFTPKRMAALQAAPMASTFAEAETKADAPPTPHWTQAATPEQLAQLQAARDANPLVVAARQSQRVVADRDASARMAGEGESA